MASAASPMGGIVRSIPRRTGHVWACTVLADTSRSRVGQTCVIAVLLEGERQLLLGYFDTDGREPRIGMQVECVADAISIHAADDMRPLKWREVTT